MADTPDLGLVFSRFLVDSHGLERLNQSIVTIGENSVFMHRNWLSWNFRFVAQKVAQLKTSQKSTQNGNIYYYFSNASFQNGSTLPGSRQGCLAIALGCGLAS
jgi:hypothetical protein